MENAHKATVWQVLQRLMYLSSVPALYQCLLQNLQ